MTPTPEDIALADRLQQEVKFTPSKDYHLSWRTPHIIAAHCAPLRERIALLEPIAVDAVAHDLDADDLRDLVRTLERKCDQLEAERDRNAEIGRELKELAEIGRLAVEERRLFNAENEFKTWEASQVVRDKACDAYLAKQEEPKP